MFVITYLKYCAIDLKYINNVLEIRIIMQGLIILSSHFKLDIKRF